MSDQELYEMWTDDNLSMLEIAKAVNSTEATVNGRVLRYARLIREERMALLEKAVDQMDEPVEETTSDLERWQETETDLMGLDRHIRIYVESDHHYIDNDEQAIALAHQIARHFKPDLNILNGDTFDFGAVSKFAQSRSDSRKDVLKEVDATYKSDIGDLHEVTEGAPIIHNSGNHNARLDRTLDEMWQFAETLENFYRKLVRADGAVMMFDFEEEITIGNLMVQHGERVGEYVAKNAAMDIGFGMAYIQGHGHAANTYHRKVKVPGFPNLYRVATSVQTGCLCHTPPRYSIRRKNWTKWTQGIALAHINPHDLDVHVQNVVFQKQSDGSLVAAVGGEIFKEPANGKPK